jgi:dihydroorotase
MGSIVILAVLASVAAAQQPQYDLLLKSGHVIDVKNHIDGTRDVAIIDGRIARVTAEINPATAKRVVDVSGL